MTSIKDKIAAVRAVVNTHSNDEIVLVLQHHDGDVDKSIADFVEGRVESILTEWQHFGQSKKSAKKKKKKKLQQKKAQQAQASAENDEPQPTALMNGHAGTPDSDNSPSDSTADTSHAAAALKQMLTNSQSKPSPVQPSDVVSPTTGLAEKDSQPATVVMNGVAPADSNLPKTSEVAKAIKQQHHLHHSGRRSRTSSESSTRSTNKKKHKQYQSNLVNSGNHANTSMQSNHQNYSSANATAAANKKSIEKAARDLHRCTVSFGRYKTLLDDEISDSYKRIKHVFEEITSILGDREVALIRKLDEMKEDAFEFIAKREAQAHDLKRQTDRAATMNHQQLNELRSNIKHFVADRKYDEELSRTSRFVYNRELLTQIIPSFGDITGVKSTSNPRTRTESTASYLSDAQSEIPPPSSHSSAKPPTNLAISDPIQPATAHSAPVAEVHVAKKVDKGKQDAVSTDAGALTSNGHVEDWAAESSDLPLPESPASWANSTPIMTPEGNKPVKEQRSAGAQPQRQQRRNRRNEGFASDKDKVLMPPPDKIPSSRDSGSKENGESSAEGRRDNRASHSEQATRRNFGGRNRGGYHRGGGDGYRNQARDGWQPRGGYRGGHRGRGSYRGSYRGSSASRYNGQHAPADQAPQDSQSKSADPPSSPHRDNKKRFENRPGRGRHSNGSSDGSGTKKNRPERSEASTPKKADTSKSPRASDPGTKSEGVPSSP